MLAQRYHPDNSDTGDEEYFKKVLSAYRVLNDPKLRAAYDTRRLADQRIRWRIFESPESAHGVAAEKRKRDGILCVLYTKRLHEPERPYMPIQELEDLLGCPRDHLHVSLWYLSEKALIRRDDRGRYEITVDGVDEAERDSLPESRIRAMLNAPDADAARPS
jgi:curved DNA-binding protein CbpA